MELGLKDKVAIVTGTGSPIGYGRGIALVLAREGCHVVGLDVDGTGSERTAEEIRSLGRKALGLKVDITDPAEVEAAVKRTLADFKQIDILINNAGMDPGWKPFMEMDLNDLRKAIEINLFGSINMVRAVAPHMISRKYGKIINFSGGQGAPNSTSYSTSKGAVDSWSEVLAKELRPQGVTVNTFLPNATKTNLGAGHMPEGFFDMIAKMQIQGRLCTTDEAGLFIAYLVSDANSFMTGQYMKI